MTKNSFLLELIACSTCAENIKTTLADTEGVGPVTVTVESSKVDVEFDQAKINANEIKAIIDNLGYEVISVL